MCDAAAVNGAVLHRARRDKETKYAELVEGDRCRLVVVPIGTGGRSGGKTIRSVWLQVVLVRLFPSCSGPRSWLGGGGGPACWLHLCSRAFAGSFTSDAEAMEGVDGVTPDLADLIGQD